MYSAGAFAQGRKSLDEDFGITKFKLNSDFDLYKKDLKYYWIDKAGTEFYDYIKGDLKTLFGKEVKNINLAFVNNKLYSISVRFGILNSIQKLELMDLLTEKYDVPEIIYPNNNLIYIARWETGKTLMHLEEYSCNDAVWECETHLFIMSKSIDKLLKEQ